MIRFTIPYPSTPSGKREFCRRFGLNAYYAGKNYHAWSCDADELHWLAIASMKRAGIRKEPADYPVEVRFFWNDGLDVDNHAVMGKAFLDAMRGYVVRDDSRKWVRKVSHAFWDGETILVEVDAVYEKKLKPWRWTKAVKPASTAISRQKAKSALLAGTISGGRTGRR